MDQSQYDTLLRVLKKGAIKACIVKQHGIVNFEYYKSKKVESSLQDRDSLASIRAKNGEKILVVFCLLMSLLH